MKSFCLHIGVLKDRSNTVQSYVKHFYLITVLKIFANVGSMRIKHPQDSLLYLNANTHQHTDLSVHPLHALPVVRCLLEGFVILRTVDPEILCGLPLIYVIVCIFKLFKGHLVCLLCSAFI